MIATRFPVSGLIRSLAFAICNIHVIHTTITQNQIAIIEFIRNAKRSIQNKTISINAVGFAIVARAKNTHEIAIYFSVSL